METPLAPITEELEGTQVQESGVPPIPQEVEEPTDEPAPTEEPTEELAPAEEPTEEPATAEDPPDELAILMATVRELAEEPDTPYAAHEGRKEGSST